MAATQKPIRDSELIEAVLTASRVLVAVAARSLAEHEAEISLQQYRALVVIASRGPQRPVDLAEALGVDPSTITRLCDRLIVKRLILRNHQADDRRQVQVTLSSQGRKIVQSVADCRRVEIGKILSSLSSGERVRIVRAFETFARAAGEIPEEAWPRSWDL